jgi:predicted DNA binding protein
MSSRERDSFVELEFSLADTAYPAIRLSQDLGCHFELLDAIRSDDQTTTAFFHVTDGLPETIVEQGPKSEYGDDVSVIERYNDECIVGISLRKSIFETLAKAQIPLQSLVITEGNAHFVATIPPDRAPEKIISLIKEKHPGVTLEKKHQTSLAPPFLTQAAFQTLLDKRLTDRQWTALYLAFKYGYFERPRRVTQKELSEKMNISPSTFGQHLHTALRKLLFTLFAAKSPEESQSDNRMGPD